jgi:hypothetical protein
VVADGDIGIGTSFDKHFHQLQMLFRYCFDHIAGPHFFECHLNGEMYLQCLQNELDNLTELLPLNLLRDMTLMHTLLDQYVLT